VEAPSLLDEFQGISDDGQRLETEEVELGESRRRDVVHRKLGHHVLVRAPAEGDALDERLVGDNDPRGVCRRVAVEPFQRARQGQQAADFLALLLLLLEPRLLLDGFLERDVENVGDELRDPVDFPVGHVQGAPHVTDDGLRLHLPEGDDLRHAVAAVFRRDVADDLVAAFHAEIGVDVGHALAIGVQKSFEEQAVADRVDLGDPDGVGHEAARRGAASGSHWNVPAFRIVDEIRDDQEVTRKPHGADDVELPGQALLIRLPQGRIPVLQDLRHEPLKPRDGHPLEVFVQGLALADLEMRQVDPLEVESEVALLRDDHRVGDRFGAVREELFHLVGRLDVEGICGELHSPGIFHGLSRLDAQQDFVGLMVGPFEIMAVVGRHERYGQFLGDFH